MLNFPIVSKEIVSNHFIGVDINDFVQAAKYIQLLPYKRNLNKENVLCVFDD